LQVFTFLVIRRGLDFLNEQGRPSEVARLVEKMGYKSRLLRSIIQLALTRMLEQGRIVTPVTRNPEAGFF
jgi:hypothetical protein